MTESFSKIEDETFPSFLGESINSSISVALENCTLASNLGLPVAASTVAKVFSGFDRLPDNQASYLDNGKLSPTNDSPRLSKSGDLKAKHVLDFKHALDQHDTLLGVSSTIQLPTNADRLPVSDDERSHLQVGQIEQAYVIPNLCKDSRKVVLVDELSETVSSLLENEKLMSIASLDDGSSDDLDDEEFYDDQLEAYFKKLLPPGMQRGVIEGQEIADPNRISFMSGASVPTRTDNLESERLHFLEDYEDDFQMLRVRLAATGMESAPSSDDDDDDQAIEMELEKAARLHLQREQFLEHTTRHLVGEQNRPSFRPGLEGGSSDDESSKQIQTVPGHTTMTTGKLSIRNDLAPQSTSGEKLSLGDGSSGSDDEGTLQTTLQQAAEPREAAFVTRNVAGAESGRLVQAVPTKQIFEDRKEPVGNGATSKENPFSSSQLDASKQYSRDDRTILNNSEGKKLDYFYLHNRSTTNQNALDDDCVNRLSDAYLSPTYQESQVSIASPVMWKSAQEQPFQWSFGNCANVEDGGSPHSVVYKNEDGKWVTDLAYYKPFDNEQNMDFSGAAEVLVKENDFIAGNDALAMIEEDQEQFEKEHRFIQEEKMDLENISLDMGDTSWKLPPSNTLPKTSQVNSDLGQDDASYLRLSLGEFFGQRSEALGCLGGGLDIKRPSFGYHIISPVKQDPIVLLKPSDISGNSVHDDTVKFLDDTLTPEDLACLPDDQKLACATFDVRTPGKRADVDQSTHQESELEEQTSNNGKTLKESAEPVTENTFLGISKITPTIADASSSTEPSQLAALMAELSQRSKTLHVASICENPDCSVSQVLSTSLQKPAPENIDMERYLKMTDISGRECEAESFAQSIKDFTWNMSSRCKQQSLQDSMGDLTNITDVEKQDMRKPDKTNGAQESSLQFGSAHERTKGNAVCCVASMGRESNVANSGSEYKKVRSSIGRTTENSKQGILRSGGKSGNRMEEVMKTGITSVAPIQSNCDTSGNEEKPSLEKLENQETGCKQGQTERSTKLKSIIPKCTKILKSPQKTSSHLSSERTFSQPHKEFKQPCQDTHQKHVTFQTIASNAIPMTNSGRDTLALEEDQYSFRPSTSPLIHSSPSQDSLKLSEQGSADCSETMDCETMDSESSCLSPSLSRLTYISTAENTLQTTTFQNSENKSNETIELSTTIVRASPTPSEMHGNPNLLSWQRKRNSASTSPIKPSKNFSTSHPNVSKEDGVLKLKDRSTLVKGTEKVNAVSASNSAVNNFSELHNPSDTAFQFPRYTMNMGQGTVSANIIPSTGLGNYPMIQSFAGNGQLVSGMKPSHPDLETVPPSVQALLAGQPRSSATFAQYLGGMPSVGNTASQTYQFGPSSFYGNHAGYTGCSIPAQLTQHNSVGMALNSNIGSALIAGLPLSNHMSEKPENARATSGYPGQVLTTAGLQQWGSRMSSGFGQVMVPEELTFSTACCVGIASQASLNIFNPNDRWMQVNFGILSIAVNGEKIDAAAYQCLVFKNKTLIGPRAGEEMKFLFLPQRSGLFQCVLGVSSWPVSADTETILRAEAMVSKVFITAVSEYPLLEVDSGKTDGLDFGDLPSGSWKALPIKIINRTHATVPIRLIISANATAWRCFTFSKDPSTLSSEYPSQVDLSKVASPSVLSHVMHASYDGKEPESIVTWVVFQAPKSYSSADCLGPAEEYVARVDVEVDSPGPACVLKSVPLRARAGCARIHAPKDLQNIHLLSTVGSSVKQLLPLKNAGNIAVHLRIKSSNPDSCFCVDPEDMFIVPGEEQVVTVKFCPQYSKLQKSVLKIMVLPSGPQYEVSVIGETETTDNRNAINPSLLNSADIPPILSNKQFVSWGGVALGRAVQQKLILRNTSTNSSQHLRLLIRGQDQDCFQLQNLFGREERLTSNRELTIHAKEDTTIHLMFSPTRVGCMLARLEIKQSGLKSALPGIKFTIPLSGYGGTSNLILENAKKLSDSYMVALNGISSGRVSKVEVLLKNTGSRAAYVRAVCFSDFQASVMMDPKVCCVKPEKFVLKERSQEVITLFCIATEREEMLSRSTRPQIATVCFFCGDEVARQQYRRAILQKPETARKIAENLKLRNAKFDEEFPGEHLVSEVYDLPQRPNDTQLFYANMNKILLSVIGSGKDRHMSGERAQMVLRTNIESSVGVTDGNLGNISLDVLPVKGPQGPPLTSNTNKTSQESSGPEQTWSIQPEHILLSAPTLSGITGTRQIKLMNNSSRLMQFELSWPAHCLTITPQHGSVEPQTHVIILVSPNPSLATKQNLLPWNGQIYVHCDSGQKCVKVQISGDNHVDKLTVHMAPKSAPILLPHPETPILVAKPFRTSLPTKVDVKNRTLVFPKTISGDSSETFLDIENPGKEDLKWLLSSFAPPYVKGIDETGEVYRANYTAFRCSRVSGVLAAHSKLKVAISFFPRDKGDYTQYWDLECHPLSEPHLKHKVRLQLCGEGLRTEDLLGRNVDLRNVVDLKTDVATMPRRRCGSEASTLKMQDDSVHGVFAPQDLYTFPPTMVGDSSTLKVNLQNNSFSTYMLKFVSPGEPFHMKHSKYSLRAHHYINLPVKFTPSSAGKFDGLLVVQADAGNICIRLVGEALPR